MQLHFGNYCIAVVCHSAQHPAQRTDRESDIHTDRERMSEGDLCTDRERKIKIEKKRVRVA